MKGEPGTPLPFPTSLLDVLRRPGPWSPPSPILGPRQSEMLKHPEVTLRAERLFLLLVWDPGKLW